MFVRKLTVIVTLMSAGALFAQNGFVYTNDDSSFLFAPNTVSLMAVQSDGSLTTVQSFLTGGTAFGGDGFIAVRRIIVSPDNRFVFASNAASNDVSVFTIDRTTGNLSPVAGSPFATGGDGCDGIGLATTPDMTVLFAANTCSENISVFRIGSNGSLALVGTPTLADATPIDLKVTNNGKFLMVSLFSSSSGLIDVFSIGNDGSLTRAAGSPFSDNGPPGESSASLETNCVGNLLFVDRSSSPPAIDVFNIDAAGSLTPIANSPFTAPGIAVTSISLSPDEKFLYAANLRNSVTSFAVAQDGSLSVVPGTPVASDGTFFLAGVATDSSGRFLYVAGSANNVAAYTTDSQGGLTLDAGSPFHTAGTGTLLSLATFPSKSCAEPVGIEVMPGEGEPAINSQSHGKIPVAILASSSFDPVTQVDTASLRFGHAGTEKSLAFCNADGEDVNGDGLSDLVCHFSAPACGFGAGDTQATLTGTTLSGTAIKGTAPITVVH